MKINNTFYINYDGKMPNTSHRIAIECYELGVFKITKQFKYSHSEEHFTESGASVIVLDNCILKDLISTLIKIYNYNNF